MGVGNIESDVGYEGVNWIRLAPNQSNEAIGIFRKRGKAFGFHKSRESLYHLSTVLRKIFGTKNNKIG